MNSRKSRPPLSEIDRVELSPADLALIQRVSELYLPELRPALRPAAAAGRPVRTGAPSIWSALVPGMALAATLVFLLSGLPALREEPARPVTARVRAAAIAESAAAVADWEEHLLFSDVVSTRGGAGSLPPEYRAIESLFFEG